MTRLRSNFLEIFTFNETVRGFRESHGGLPVSVPPEAAEDGLGVAEAGEGQLRPAPDLAVEDGDPGLMTEAESLSSLHRPVARDRAPQAPVLRHFGIQSLK